jgi:hypothetical protein
VKSKSNAAKWVKKGNRRAYRNAANIDAVGFVPIGGKTRVGADVTPLGALRRSRRQGQSESQADEDDR